MQAKQPDQRTQTGAASAFSVRDSGSVQRRWQRSATALCFFVVLATLVAACSDPDIISCDSSTDCPDLYPICRAEFSACDNCATNADCQTAGLGNFCNPDTNACAQVLCVADTDCPQPNTPVCNPADNTCVGCVDDMNCDQPGARVCDMAINICVGCVDDMNCDQPGARVCDMADNTCVGCVDSDDCSSLFPICTDANLCVECLDNNQCTAPEVCNTDDNACVECLDNNQCTAPEVCNTDDNACVECLDNNQCTAPKVCNTDDNRCE